MEPSARQACGFHHASLWYTHLKISHHRNILGHYHQNCSSVVLGTENFNPEETFKIYTSSNNKFKILSNKNTEFKVRIFNINGLKIESTEFIEKEFEIDLSTYSAGIYFINITYENNIIQNFKIIKK